MANEQVVLEVITKFKSENEGRMDRVRQMIAAQTAELKKMASIMRSINAGVGPFKKGSFGAFDLKQRMVIARDNIVQYRNALRQMEASQRKFNVSMGESAKKTKWFRMEFLGLMFYGQMMQRVGMQMLSPAMEAFGIFDIFGSVLLVVFLPIIEYIFPLLMWFAEWLMSLPGLS